MKFIAPSALYNQDTFDKQFIRDISRARSSVLIESPFIRLRRVEELAEVLKKLRRRGVAVIVNTRNPIEHNSEYELQASQAITLLQDYGVTVLFTVKHHRKIVICDRQIFYEGSLNVLSYFDSCEIMRRTDSPTEAEHLINFIGLSKFLPKES